jgi:dihydroneopterin aldolase
MSFDDKICLPELQFRVKHGVLPAEHEFRQDFSVSLTVVLDLSVAGQSDDLNDTLDYRGLYQAVDEVMRGEHRDLLEKLAADIAKSILQKFAVKEVWVRVRKEAADLGGVETPTEVEIRRKAGDF